MHAAIKALLITMMVLSTKASYAQNAEAPPREPPYVDDNEFDPVQSEDPAASKDAIAPSQDPVPSQTQQSQDPIPAPEPQPSEQAARPPKNSSVSYSKEYNAATRPERGVKLLHHPDAKKGLYRIEQDGTYVYRVKTMESKQSGILRFGMMEPPKITAADGVHDFSSMYGNEGMFTVMGDYEWQPFKSFGKLGVQLGVGFATAEGVGFFESPDVNGNEPLESYTFFAFPVTAGVVYRLELFRKQWLAPYVSGGLSYIGVAELRDDNESHFSGTPGAYGAGGIMFNLSAFDKSLSFSLSNEYNIANLWIIGEYRYLQAFSETLDFSGGLMTIGVGADF